MSIHTTEDNAVIPNPHRRTRHSPKPLPERARKIIERFTEHSKGVPVRFQNLFDKIAKRTASPRQAIKAKCHECVGFEDAKDRIQNCTAYRCPLLPYRPYQ